MSNTQSAGRFISIPAAGAASGSMRFELQPILGAADFASAGFEMLYRGERGVDWNVVDWSVISHLGAVSIKRPLLYVNLSNESLLKIPAANLIAAARRNSLVYEISEAHSDQATFAKIAAKVNDLIDHGLEFAIDDFGSGRDGLERLYTINRVRAVKIDGQFIKNAMRRPDATGALKALVWQWKNNQICVVAEGVENQELLAFSRRVGVDLLQGWHVDSIYDSRLKAA